VDSSSLAWGKHPIASVRFFAYQGVVMHPLEATSYLVPVGFRLVIQAAILVVAVIAARRYKLKGLWILVAAVFLAVFQDVMGLVSSSLLRAGHENAMTYSAWLQYVPWVTMILVLCGWCVLAFSRKQGAKPEASQ
jgi:divalent metal cation (Fe/Co/Zn/Cd) transporter